MTAMVAFDQADMAAHVTWQPRVCCGMNVLRADSIAWLELRRRGRSAPEFAAYHDTLDIIEGEPAPLERFRWAQRVTGGDFVGCNVALGEQQVFEPKQPLLVI